VEMNERRRLEKEVELDATPEQVWEAVSTAAGMSLWFVPHESGPDGDLQADFGGGNAQGGKVLAWDPGRRVVYGGPQSESEDRFDFALEFLVEGRAGGGAVLRLVQSGFFDGDDWESEYKNVGKGWDLFLHNLAEYFHHFAGLPVVNVVAAGFTALDVEEVWTRYRRELGIDQAVTVGERVQLRPDGVEGIDGVVDVADRGVLGIRTDAGFYRFLGGGGDATRMVNVAHYFYGVDVDRARATAAWQGWLDRLFPASA
jgi:uncharacterized protein YndB with AHSA1/START domain